MLGIAQELEVRLGLGIDADAARQAVAVEGCARAFLAEIAGDGRSQFLDGHRGAPQPEARRDGSEVGGDEQISLQPFNRGRRPPERKDDIGEDIEREAPDHAVSERRQIEPEESLRAQQRDSPGSLREQALPDDAGVRQARQQQRIGPGQDSDCHSPERTARGRPPPDQPPEKGRGKLRNGRKGQQPDRGKLRIASQAIVHIGKNKDHEDCHPPHGQQQPAHIVASGDKRFPALQHQRHDDVVRYHDGECDKFHDHHRGRRRKATDKGRNREQVGMRGER